MPKVRRVAPVRSAKSIAVRVNSKIGGRKSKTSVKGLSNEALLKEVTQLKRARDKSKVLSEIRNRKLTLVEPLAE